MTKQIRVRYTEEQEDWIREVYYKVNSYDELTLLFNETFGVTRKKDSIREKCTKSLGLKGMPNPTTYGLKEKEQLPIGSIRKSQNATYIKVADSANKGISGYQEPYWLPLQKKIYQDAFGKIGPNEMVCFLDGDNNNFDLNNLYPINRKISAIMSKNKWWTNSRDHTLAAIKWCELFYVLKNMKGEKHES